MFASQVIRDGSVQALVYYKFLCVLVGCFATMTGPTKSCYICSEDSALSPIYLPDTTPIFVGRNITTQITDTKCSRQQIWLCASYADQNVFVKQVGSYPSGCNGFKMQRNVKFIAKHGDRLEILYNKYPYSIEFNPPPEDKSVIISKKRIHDSNSEDEVIDDIESTNAKKFKTDNRDEKNFDIMDDSVTSERDTESKTNELKEIPRIIAESIESDASFENCNMERTSSNQPQKPTEREIWEEIDNKALLIYTSKGVVARSKIAAYDMDCTLIKTKSGLVWPKDHNDWQIILPEVPGKLKKWFADEYKIVIFTNQGGISKGKSSISDFKSKIERVVRKLGVPIQVFIATGRNKYRKPVLGMWEALINNKNDGVSVSKELSFYVGDAAGRKNNWGPKKKKDHSSADILFALNLDLKFQTPEEHFLGHNPPPRELLVFDPKKLNENDNITNPPDAKLQAADQEVIILVGSPGSGKSHFARTHLINYQWINRDNLGSWQKCSVALDSALSQGKSVVVDNTHPDPPTRQRYIKVAKKHKVPVRCFLMTTSVEHSKHNNKFRELTDTAHATITDILIHSYIDTKSRFIWRCIRFAKLLLLLILNIYVRFLTSDQPYRKNFVPPTLDEGYEEIVKINFVPKFKNPEERRLYRMYLLEK